MCGRRRSRTGVGSWKESSTIVGRAVGGRRSWMSGLLVLTSQSTPTQILKSVARRRYLTVSASVDRRRRNCSTAIRVCMLRDVNGREGGTPSPVERSILQARSEYTHVRFCTLSNKIPKWHCNAIASAQSPHRHQARDILLNKRKICFETHNSQSLTL